MRFSRSGALILSAIVALYAKADVSLPSIFSDHMVLQTGSGSEIWGKADAGEKVTVTIGEESQSAEAGADGKWRVTFQSLKSGGPVDVVVAGKNTIKISDVLIGEVWLCSGQSNMDFRIAKTKERSWCGLVNEKEEIAAANFPEMRVFMAEVTMRDEPQDDVAGKWVLVSPETAGELSAVAYFFGRDLHQSLKTPVGLVVTTFGASTAQAWISKGALESNPELSKMLTDYDQARKDFDSGEAQKKYEAAKEAHAIAAAKAKEENKPAPRAPGAPKDPRKDQHNPCVLYNGMLKPLAPYGISGVIWYQGESNGYNSELYFSLMKTLIEDWRRDWQKPELAFISVQLANYKAPATQPVQGNSQIARVRDAQMKTMSMPNVGLASAVDIGDAKDVHPKNKQEVGKRLAMAAKNMVYKQDVASSGPIYQSTEPAAPGSIRVRFTHTDGGLVAKDTKLTGFAICDAQKIWHSAEATIDGDTVIVSSPDVPQPTAVRYAWADNPPISLYNGAGLPASPFKTDE